MPSALLDCDCCGSKNELLLPELLVVTTMSTTPGDVRLYRLTSDEPLELLRSAAGWTVPLAIGAPAAGDAPEDESAMAYAPTPVPAPTAATTASAASVRWERFEGSGVGESCMWGSFG